MVYRRNPGLHPSPVRTAVLRAAHRANAQKSTGPVTAPGEAQVAWNGLPTEVAPLARKASGGGGRLEEQAAGGAVADPIAVVSWCRAREGALTSKAGMSFRFKGIMLATPPSIKDSG